ncbi:hypothetical protein JOD54_005715 [Actinokineospora baliensis]|uniref:GNAT family N-acetyltransferase n=1 Tax=Actinokineospora baliensis TaxID=547056 RepID=UPI0019566820|nr:GNAT family N-acetyltransferase [Actinokineospora baliensis]MBM7775511.1 hypothetical protein [Actinokineospora baliensis]
MHGELLTDLAEVRAAGWADLVSPGDLLHCLPWLALNAETADAPPRYAVVRDSPGGAARAGLACYPLAADSTPFPFLRPDAHIERIAGNRGLAADLDLGALLPSLVCGQRRGAESRLLLSDRLTGADRCDAADLAVRTAEDLAAEEGMSAVAFLFVGADDVDLHDVLQHRGYLSFPGDTQAVLPVPTGGFDAYLAELTKNRRAAVRKEKRKVADAGVGFSVVPAERADLDTLLSLEAQLLGKYGHEPDVGAMSAMHVEVAKRFPGAVDYLLAHDKVGKTIGFVQLIRKDHIIHPRSVGFDYTFRAELPLYFELVYYQTIQYAMDRACGAIDYSVEAEHAKATRGCRMIRLSTYIKPRNAMARAVTEQVCALLGRSAPANSWM